MAEKKPQPSGQPPSNPQGRAQTMDELRYLQQLYQNQYAMINQEINTRLAALREMDDAQKTLENIDQFKDKGMLTPVGAAVYLPSKSSEQKNVMVGVGAGFMLEKDVASGKAHIAKMMERETNYINSMAKNKKEIETALLDISYKIEELLH